MKTKTLLIWFVLLACLESISAQWKNRYNIYCPNKGEVNKVVVFVRFSDEQEYTDSISVYEKLYTDSSGNARSLYNYFKEASYGKLFIKSYFMPRPINGMTISYQDPHPRAFYQRRSDDNIIGYVNNFDSTIARQDILVKGVTDYIRDNIPDSLELDQNKDGFVDNVSLFIKGKRDGVNPSMTTLLWPSCIPFPDYTFMDSIIINNLKLGWIEFIMQDFIISKGCSDAVHETYHTIGAPDLYHFNSGYPDPTGMWDNMGTWQRSEQLCAYSRYRYGKWIDSILEIKVDGRYSLKSLNASEKNCYKIISPYSTKEYFVLEYRRKEGNFDKNIPGSGLLVFRINTQADGKGNFSYPNYSDEVYVYRPGGSTNSEGEVLNAHLNAEKNCINDNSKTRCFLSDGRSGGIDISNIHEEGDSIVFDVKIVKAFVQSFKLNSNLKIFPNPGSNLVHFANPVIFSSSIQLQLYNYTGCLILARSLQTMQQGETVTLDLGNQPAGVYLVRLCAGGAEYCGKFLLLK